MRLKRRFSIAAAALQILWWSVKPAWLGGKSRATVRCSFCGKIGSRERPIVEGVGEAFICGECAQEAARIAERDRRRRSGPA